ncbi:hypothetical protein EYF80_006959 [Liparis tanakae]|uniref:Uncharacterized protein n=1 Tax=Liparis tanakae TaxID=230148 RepID=A0A4Z2IYZ2_9TELE|nr:hypothetical protein EYF80_006959 [Liparis tanakae]
MWIWSLWRRLPLELRYSSSLRQRKCWVRILRKVFRKSWMRVMQLRMWTGSQQTANSPTMMERDLAARISFCSSPWFWLSPLPTHLSSISRSCFLATVKIFRKSPAALGSDARPPLVALSAPELPFPQLLDFKFQPKKGMRPMTKERIHRMAMISLAVFPVISSLYLEKDAEQATGLIISPAWRFWTRVTLKVASVVLLVVSDAGVGLLVAAHIILKSGRTHEASRDVTRCDVPSLCFSGASTGVNALQTLSIRSSASRDALLFVALQFTATSPGAAQRGLRWPLPPRPVEVAQSGQRNFDGHISINSNSQEAEDGALCQYQNKTGQEEASVEVQMYADADGYGKGDGEAPHQNISHSQRHQKVVGGVLQSGVDRDGPAHQHVARYGENSNDHFNHDVDRIHLSN